MKTDCAFAESLSSWIDGELPPEESGRVRLHLKTCPVCQDYFKSLSGMNQQLAVMPTVSPTRDFDRTFWQKVDALEKRRWRWAWRDLLSGDWFAGWRPALAAAAGVLMVTGAAFMGQKPDAPDLSVNDIVVAENLELLADYGIVTHLDLLEHWTEISDPGESTDV